MIYFSDQIRFVQKSIREMLDGENNELNNNKWKIKVENQIIKLNNNFVGNVSQLYSQMFCFFPQHFDLFIEISTFFLVFPLLSWNCYSTVVSSFQLYLFISTLIAPTNMAVILFHRFQILAIIGHFFFSLKYHFILRCLRHFYPNRQWGQWEEIAFFFSF